MKLKIDKENDALYLRLDETEIVDSEEVQPGVELLIQLADNRFVLRSVAETCPAVSYRRAAVARGTNGERSRREHAEFAGFRHINFPAR